MSTDMHLGLFKLENQIGKGGMGVVWSAMTDVIGAQVAVKVISKELIQNRGTSYNETLVQEVASVAKLNHNNICRVYDFGYVDETTAQSSKGELLEGSPWFAMEYAPDGALDENDTITDWPSLKNCLVQLLQGLAHAHARRLIHRDIKPGNVLVFKKDNAPIRYAFTDFGLAIPMEMAQQPASKLSQPSGTPYYMPSEQFNGQWRDFGPWTDLYALGCMTFELVTGLPPFTGRSMVELAMKHANERIPTMRAKFAVPMAFEQWVARLLAKHPMDRFTLASDAIWALQAMPQSPMLEPKNKYAVAFEPFDSFAHTLDQLPDDDTKQDTLLFDSNVMIHISQTDQQATGPLKSRQAHLLEQRAPIPTTWQMDEGRKVVHTGPGLFAMRTTPFVGRLEERDRIWQDICHVEQHHKPKLLCISGESGTGKSRLSEWMTQRIEELGAAMCIPVHHDQRPGPTHGIGYALERILHCRGLDADEAFERVLNWLSFLADDQTPHSLIQHTARSAVAIMDPAHAHLASFSNENERYAALVLLLSLISQTRPIVLWFDDIQWSQLSSKFVAYLLNAQPAQNLPIYILASARTKETWPQALTELIEANPESHMTLGALPEKTHREFISKLLPLNEHIVDRLAMRTQGNPLFAMQIVHDWLNHDMLKLTPEGFALSMDTLPDLPVALHDLWQKRLRDVCDLGFTSAQQVIEIASCLGSQFHLYLWANICQRAGCPLNQELIDVLIHHDLIERPDTLTIRFAHNLLRESVEKQSKASGQWTEYHGHCADHLMTLDYADSPDVRLRTARHLQEAARLEEALTLFELCAKQLMDESNYPLAIQAHESIDALCDAMHLAPNAKRRLQHLPFMADILRFRGENKGAEEILMHAQKLTPPDNHTVRAHTLRVLAGIRMMQNRILEGEALMIFASSIFEAGNDPHGQAKAQHGLGWYYMLTKRLNEARPAFEMSIKLGEQHKDPKEIGWAMLGLADYYVRTLKRNAAIEYAKKSIVAFEKSNTRAGISMAQRTLAGIYAFEGYYEKALAFNKVASVWFEQVDSPMRHYTGMLNGLVYFAQNDVVRARPYIEETAQARGAVIRPVKVSGQLAMLGVYASDQDWIQFDELMDKMEKQSIMMQSDIHLCYVLELVSGYLIKQNQQDRLPRIKSLAKKFVDTNALPQLCDVIDAHDTHWLEMMIQLQAMQESNV